MMGSKMPHTRSELVARHRALNLSYGLCALVGVAFCAGALYAGSQNVIPFYGCFGVALIAGVAMYCFKFHRDETRRKLQTLL